MQELISPKHLFCFPYKPSLHWNGHSQLLSQVYFTAFHDFRLDIEEMIAGCNKVIHRSNALTQTKLTFRALRRQGNRNPCKMANCIIMSIGREVFASHNRSETSFASTTNLGSCSIDYCPQITQQPILETLSLALIFTICFPSPAAGILALVKQKHLRGQGGCTLINFIA